MGAAGNACSGGRPSLVTPRSLHLTLLSPLLSRVVLVRTRALLDLRPPSCQLSSLSFQGCGMTVQPNKIRSGDKSPSEAEGGKRPCPER